MSIQPSDELIEKIKDEEVREELYSDNEATSTTYAKVQEGTIDGGYEGVIVGLAVSSDDQVIAYIKRDEKDYYENGLNCGGLSHVPEAAGTAGLVGVGPEIPLLIRVKEKGSWELGFKAKAGTPTISWRLRVRQIKKS